MKVENAVMINILGKENKDVSAFHPDNELKKKKNCYLHLYGKSDDRIGRKMGHITLTGSENIDTLTEEAIRLREKINL